MDKHLARHAILKEAIMLAPFEGWTEPMLNRANARAGYDEATLTRSFQTIPEVIEFWSHAADAAMEKYAITLALSEMKVHQRIAALVMFRLEHHLSEREALRRAVHVMMTPHNAALNLKLLKRTVNLMWQLVGDQSHDYNWYTKRLLLAGVFSSTLLFWLNDESEARADTQQFLHRRIGEVLKIGGAVSKFIKRTA